MLVNPDGTEAELYNIPNDPMEMRNMVNEEPGIAKKLKDELLKWDDTLPYNDVYENYKPKSHKWVWPEEKRGVLR